MPWTTMRDRCSSTSKASLIQKEQVPRRHMGTCSANVCRACQHQYSSSLPYLMSGHALLKVAL